MSLGGSYRDRLWLFVFNLVVLLGFQTPQCQGTTLFGDAPPTVKGSNRDLPAIATAFVQTGNELHYFSDVQYHEDLIGGAPVKRLVQLYVLLEYTICRLHFLLGLRIKFSVEFWCRSLLLFCICICSFAFTGIKIDFL